MKYEGKISNKGAQMVKAPHAQKPAKGGTVKKGDDLRTGKKGGG